MSCDIFLKRFMTINIKLAALCLHNTVEAIFTVYNVTHVETIFTVHYDRAAPKLCLCDVGVDLPCIGAITSTDEYYI